ncbi:MAG: HvfC/BufC family peptide modification chaperone, partial [Candidatus Binatia bacterium]
MTSLDETQRIFFELIRAPEGVRQGLGALADRERRLPLGLEGLIAGDERLSSIARLDVYANMYFYRILDVLKEDFPALLAVIGDTRFHNLVT